MAEYNPFVRGDEVAAILKPFSRGGTLRIESKDFCRDELAVEAISDSVGADSSGYQPKGVDLFTAMQSNGAEGNCTEDSNCNPSKSAECGPHRRVTEADLLWLVLEIEASCVARTLLSELLGELHSTFFAS
jgi:hypothetical protein